MNKKELVAEMAWETKLSYKDTRDTLDAFMKVMTKALSKNENVTLVGFGGFSVKRRASRCGINPATLEKVDVPSKNVVKFKVGSELSKAINKE